MCLNPVLILNPNYHNDTPLIKRLYDTECQYIRVPCNNCSECLKARQGSLVQRSRTLLVDHYLYFCTLTYNSESLPVIKCSNGYEIPYADISDVQRMFKRIRLNPVMSRPFKYFFVSERGKSRSRPHFHGLIFIRRYKDDDSLFPAQFETSLRKLLFSEWKRNYGSDRVPIWKPLFTYRTKYVGGILYKNFDLHYVVPHSTENGESDVAFYVTKYVLKPNDKERRLQQALRLNLDEDEYNDIWKIVRSRCVCSKGFGSCTESEISLVKSFIHRSKDNPDGFKYYNPDGSVYPLARYYNKFIDESSAIASVDARGGPVSYDDRDILEKDLSSQNGERIISKVSQRDISELFDL